MTGRRSLVVSRMEWGDPTRERLRRTRIGSRQAGQRTDPLDGNRGGSARVSGRLRTEPRQGDGRGGAAIALVGKRFAGSCGDALPAWGNW